MVSRRTRGSKEKKPMTAFGQFMLPLAVIMMVALLYFSIKLFFLTPGGVKNSNTPASHVTSSAPPITTVAPTPAAVNEPVASVTVRPATVIAGPVTSVATVNSVRPQPESPATAPRPKLPVAAPKSTPATSAATPTKATKTSAATPIPATMPPVQVKAVLRYDVQIGAFTTRENAQQLVKAARGQGYVPYIDEAIHKNVPHFRVRVKGPVDRAATQALSAKLQRNNYPVYIVPILK